VSVDRAEPDVRVQEAEGADVDRVGESQEPEVTVTTAEGEPQIDYQSDDPNVQVEQQEAEVTIEQAEPDVTVVQPDEQQQEPTEEEQAAQQQEPTEEEQAAQQQEQEEQQAAQQLPGQLQDYIGQDAYNAEGNTIGEVEAAVRDPETGQEYFVINYGGFLGIGDKSVSVEIDRFRVGENDRLVAPEMTEQELDQMEEYDATQYEQIAG